MSFRYNPNNCSALEDYLEMQCSDHGYDLEANLALLKLYQFNPSKSRMEVRTRGSFYTVSPSIMPILFFLFQMVIRILLKALTNLPHSDFICCKGLLTQENLEDPVIKNIQVRRVSTWKQSTGL